VAYWSAKVSGFLKEKIGLPNFTWGFGLHRLLENGIMNSWVSEE
jgi:hypothetical protein